MILRECQIFKLRFVAQIALCGLLALLAVGGVSKDKHLTHGEEYLQKRKFQEAGMEFRAAAGIDKDSAAAHGELKMFLLFDAASQSLILGFVPESLGVLFFGIVLVLSTVGPRAFETRRKKHQRRNRTSDEISLTGYFFEKKVEH